jgi:hypothetical protein
MYAYIKNWVIDCISYEIIEMPDSEMIEYQDSIWNPIYSNGEILEYVDEESVKKYRIFSSIISTQDISSLDLEWVTFSDIEIGEIIRSRVFAGNPYAESALQAKTSAYLLSAIAGNPNDELLASIQDKQEKINEIRLKFGLTII